MPQPRDTRRSTYSTGSNPWNGIRSTSREAIFAQHGPLITGASRPYITSKGNVTSLVATIGGDSSDVTFYVLYNSIPISSVLSFAGGSFVSESLDHDVDEGGTLTVNVLTGDIVAQDLTVQVRIA